MEALRENAGKAAFLLKQLANENRLLILCALIEEPLNVTSLNACLPTLSQSALSQHLAKMRDGGLLSAEAVGPSMVYSVADPRVISLMERMKELFC